MASCEESYHCPRCRVIVVLTDRDESFTCLDCRTAVVLVDRFFCYHGSLDGRDLPIRSALERCTPA